MVGGAKNHSQNARTTSAPPVKISLNHIATYPTINEDVDEFL